MSAAKQSLFSQIEEARDYLLQRAPDFEPELGIVLGSGLGGFGKRIKVYETIPYSEIPHFKPVGVEGHDGNLILGEVAGKKIICQAGRYHFYEGHNLAETVLPIRLMRNMGAKHLLVSNAAGGINLAYRPGHIMMIVDHINFQGTNPLMGHNVDQMGPRFPDMTEAYDRSHREALLAIAAEKNIAIHQGVYISVTGPSYETPAEIRAFRTLGADAVGMSTVNEVIAANHCGMRVLGLSCISNAAAGMGEEKLDHADVKDVVNTMALQFEDLVETWIGKL